jgi:hypothetical protein
VNANDKNDRADPISKGPPDISLLPAVIDRIEALERRVTRLEMEHEDDTTGD